MTQPMKYINKILGKEAIISIIGDSYALVYDTRKQACYFSEEQLLSLGFTPVSTEDKPVCEKCGKDKNLL